MWLAELSTYRVGLTPSPRPPVIWSSGLCQLSVWAGLSLCLWVVVREAALRGIVGCEHMVFLQAHYSTGKVSASFTSTAMVPETTHEAGTSCLYLFFTQTELTWVANGASCLLLIRICIGSCILLRAGVPLTGGSLVLILCGLNGGGISGAGQVQSSGLVCSCH